MYNTCICFGLVTVVIILRVEGCLECCKLFCVMCIVLYCIVLYWGYAVGQLVEALHYKPEVREFDSLWYH